MAGGIPTVVGSSQAWATVVNQYSTSLNEGWLPDTQIGSTGLMSTNTSPSSSSTWFFTTGDGTAFYLHGRRLRIVQGGVTTYCEVISSSSGPTGSTTMTQVTIGMFLSSTGLSTGAITSVAASPTYPSTGGNGNHPNDWGTAVMIRTWGL